MDEWSTPQPFFDLLNHEFHFTLDPCATPANAKCPTFITKEQDALSIPWPPGNAFINPPYGPHGQSLLQWIRRTLYEHSAQSRTAVILLPVRADTSWWQFCTEATEIRFMRNRLYFTNAHRTLRAPFATCLWIFKPLTTLPKGNPLITSLTLPKHTRGWLPNTNSDSPTSAPALLTTTHTTLTTPPPEEQAS